MAVPVASKRIWKEQNARAFDQKEKAVESLVADIKEDVMVWRAAAPLTCQSPGPLMVGLCGTFMSGQTADSM
uniref:Uncharacterized protein n=1 Tax=Oryza rufipogon TaxID=4529 RepID=A0A0E0NJ80_ORYRU